MPTEKFVAYLTTIMLGTIAGVADLLEIDLDPDRPLRGATVRGAAAS
jgi:hypothetical protein